MVLSKKKIISILKRFPSVFAVVNVIRNRNNEEYLSLVNGLDNNPNVALLYPKKDDLYTGKPVCIIQAGTKNDGFFACVRWALDGIYFCDQLGLIPVVRFSKDSIYKDNIFPDDINVFNYYFSEVSDINYIEIDKYPKVIYHPRNTLMAENMTGGIVYNVTPEYIETMAHVMEKYLHFNENVTDSIERHIDKIGIDDSVLGIHIRGTDYRKKYRNHPVFIPSEDYYHEIDMLLEKKFFSKIYLATDDLNILQEFLERYGNEQIIYSKDTKRSSGEEGVHTSKIQNGKTPYYIGLEVIQDMCALSMCGGIISGLSQVAMIARIYAASRNHKYVYDTVLNKGTNKSGRMFIRSK